MISIVKDDNFEEQKENIRLLRESDPGAARAINIVEFQVGEKLSINVEITDRYLSSVIFALLYNPETIPGHENLGFKITSMGPKLNRDKVVQELHTLTLRLGTNEFE